MASSGATVFLLPDAGPHDFGVPQQLSKSITIQSTAENSYATITTSTMTSGSLFDVAGGVSVAINNIVADLSSRNLPGFSVIASSSGANIILQNVSIRCMHAQDSCVPLSVNGGSIQGTNITVDVRIPHGPKHPLIGL